MTNENSNVILFLDNFFLQGSREYIILVEFLWVEPICPRILGLQLKKQEVKMFFDGINVFEP